MKIHDTPEGSSFIELDPTDAAVILRRDGQIDALYPDAALARGSVAVGPGGGDLPDPAEVTAMIMWLLTEAPPGTWRTVRTEFGAHLVREYGTPDTTYMN